LAQKRHSGATVAPTRGATVIAMPWQPRIEFHGALYHVTTRTIEPLFTDAADRERFLLTLAKVVERHRWICHAYCLMGNHFHLLLETPEPNLAGGMRDLSSDYVRYFNIHRGRRGPLSEKRYRAVLVEREAHLLEVARYVVLNPARAGICERAEDWPWSSYRATAGLTPVPRFLHTEWLLAQFDGNPHRYRAFIADGGPAASLPGLLIAA
jgi:putative transposase